MDLDTRRLRVFLVVAEELHFSRAARRLHISQPALSQQIRTLEREIGVPLFSRSSRQVELTASGRALLETAPIALYEVSQAMERAQHAANGDVGRLAIGSVRTGLASITPRIMRAVREELPMLRLDAFHMDTAAQLISLSDRRIDVGVVRAAPASEDIAVQPLVTEPLHVVLPADHPLAATESVDPAALAAEPFVLWPRHLGADFFDIVIVYCREHGFSPRIAAEGTDIDTQLALVAAGIGVSLQPSFYASAQVEGVAFRRLTGPAPEVGLQLAWRRADNTALIRRVVTLAGRVSRTQ